MTSLIKLWSGCEPGLLGCEPADLAYASCIQLLQSNTCEADAKAVK